MVWAWKTSKSLWKQRMCSLVLCFDVVSLSTWVIPSLLAGAKGKGYGTFHEEAIRIFNSLQEQESIADPIPVIQVIITGCCCCCCCCCCFVLVLRLSNPCVNETFPVPSLSLSPLIPARNCSSVSSIHPSIHQHLFIHDYLTIQRSWCGRVSEIQNSWLTNYVMF